MPEQIHLAVVAVAEPAVGDGGPHAGGQITERLHPDIAATAQDRAGQAGTGELRAGDDAHRDACRRPPVRRSSPSVAPARAARFREDRRPTGCGRHRSGLITPTPGSRNDSPTSPCSPDRQPVPTAASPATVVDGNPACSVRPRSAAITGASSAWASRSSAAETVDQQHARAADVAGQIDPAVEARHTHRRQHRRHHVGQMGSVRVRLRQVHIASLPYSFRYAAADKTVAGIGLTLLLGACATSNPTAVPTPAAGSEAAGHPRRPADRPGLPPTMRHSRSAPPPPTRSAATFPTVKPSRRSIATNPVIAWLDPPLLAAIQKAARSAEADGIDVADHVGLADQGFPAAAVR